MRIFGTAERFTGFGRDPFGVSSRIPDSTTVTGRRKADLKAQVRAACPRTPGVYGMIDASGRLIYVGKSKALRSRLLSYFSAKVAREKPGHILRETSQLIWEQQPNEFAALLRELYLIRTWRPRWNVKDQPRSRMPSYVCLGRGPARHLFVTTSPPRGSASYGPFHSRSRLIRSVESLNHHYRLRDCTGTRTFHFVDQRELFPEPHRAGCLRYEIGSCLGPCAAGCSRQAYAAQARRAKRFLDGQDNSPLTDLTKRMTRAATEQRFETAARLRDRLSDVEWLAARLEYLRTARERFNFVYPVQSTNGRELWYLIAQGCVAAAVHAPTTRRRASATQRTIENWQSDRHLSSFPIVQRHPTITLLSHWFRTRPDELTRTLTIHQALERCRQRSAPVEIGSLRPVQ